MENSAGGQTKWRQILTAKRTTIYLFICFSGVVVFFFLIRRQYIDQWFQSRWHWAPKDVRKKPPSFFLDLDAPSRLMDMINQPIFSPAHLWVPAAHV